MLCYIDGLNNTSKLQYYFIFKLELSEQELDTTYREEPLRNTEHEET